MVPSVELTRIWGDGEEKDDRMKPGGNDGQIATYLQQRIQAASSLLI
jgi:hypothetical protein